MLLRLWEIVPILPRYGNFRKSKGPKKKAVRDFEEIDRIISNQFQFFMPNFYTYALIQAIAFSLGLWGVNIFFPFFSLFLEALSDYLQEIAMEAPKTPFFFYHLPSISNVYGMYKLTNHFII